MFQVAVVIYLLACDVGKAIWCVDVFFVSGDVLYVPSVYAMMIKVIFGDHSSSQPEFKVLACCVGGVLETRTDLPNRARGCLFHKLLPNKSLKFWLTKRLFEKCTRQPHPFNRILVLVHFFRLFCTTNEKHLLTMSAFRALRQLTSVSSRVVTRPALRSGRTLRLSTQAAPRIALSATRAFSMTSCRFSEGTCT